MSADNLPDKSRNLSSYLMEYGSSEKFELLLEKVLTNITENIFPKYLL
jgi:hypothetical protein